MPLKQLTASAALPSQEGEGEVLVRGLSADSRSVRDGFLFAAFAGARADGTDYIREAIDRGAVAILTAPEIDLPAAANGVIHLTADNPRKEYALMASRFFPYQYGDIVLPRVIAITGTNGKTSVASFARYIWERLGFKAASIGTLGLLADRFHLSSSLTTPSADIIHRMLSGLARRSYQRVALEASSHGLAQHRLDGIAPAAAIFTRLGTDHLDYHQNQAAYLEAKLRLIDEILPQGGVFVCDDDAPGAKEALRVAAARGHKIIRVGERAGVEIQIKHCAPHGLGQALDIIHQGVDYHIAFPLVGRFQAVNALLAVGAIMGMEEGLQPRAVFSILESVPCVPARLERVISGNNSGADIYIDYAHTPDALESALSALRESLAAGGRLHLVFGAGGDRDRSKRPLMARVAGRLADEVVITDDNPRFEDAGAIRAQLHAALPSAKNIGDRREAIAEAMKQLKPQDILLVAGKGHENYQEREGKRIKFSDAEIIREFIDV